jgi:hypothetical protein
MPPSKSPLPAGGAEPEDLLPEEVGERQSAFPTPEEYAAAKKDEAGRRPDAFFAPNAFILTQDHEHDHPEDDDHSTAPLMPGGFV